MKRNLYYIEFGEKHADLIIKALKAYQGLMSPKERNVANELFCQLKPVLQEENRKDEEELLRVLSDLTKTAFPYSHSSLASVQNDIDSLIRSFGNERINEDIATLVDKK